jgi:dTDP-4-amino-4,6-dideoxygalactose transaminase
MLTKLDITLSNSSSLVLDKTNTIHNKRDVKLPIMKPLLPKADLITKYIEEIDTNRWYTNFGPLIFRFEEQLAKLFNIRSSSLVTLCNGTVALTNILQAMNIEVGSFCLLPSWTFIATPASAVQAGLIPYFIDVDENSWALSPKKIKQALRKISGKIGAVIVVAPFGAPLNIQDWDDFTSTTGIPVIIDAAAGFDSVASTPEMTVGMTPLMISLHATKPFGIGEGGLVLSQDYELIHRIRQISNFGFTVTRDIPMLGSNSKLSEYNAAIGLAALEEWPSKRQKWEALTRYYIEKFTQIANNNISHNLSTRWISSTCNIKISTDNLQNVMTELANYGIESRKWWNSCHKAHAYQQFPCLKLPITEKLDESVIALPFVVDLTEEEVAYIVSTINAILI